MCRSSFPRSSLGRRLFCSIQETSAPQHLLPALSLVIGLHFSTAVAATLPSGFTETSVATGLAAPTAMAFAPDGRLFVCQQAGQLRVIKNGTLLAAPFLTVTVNSSGERGLLGVAFDPYFTTNGFVYIYYTATTPAIHNRVSRFTANGDVAVPGSEVAILDLNNLSSATNHNGGAIHFGPDGQLYIGVGENANSANAQTLSNLLGKILRINSDGSIPTDNPFFNTATGVNRAIWALGLRNPFTFGFQPGSGRMLINDVGQNTWEEIDDGITGSNYGWPTCEGSCSPPNPNFRDPLFQYGHGTSATTGCAIVGAAFYNPSINQFGGDYLGKYFFADLCSGWIRRFDPATNTATDFASGIASPVDVEVAADGSLYYLAQGGGGAVFRVQHSPATLDSFQFSQSAFGVNESDARVTITVNRLGSLSSDATVDYATSNGTASGRSDYTTATGTMHFSPGESSHTFNVLITDDAYVEGSESVNLSLSNATGGTVLGATSTATLTINDNDAGTPTGNPADVAQFFVRQHYSDFLDRTPDQAGLDYWTQQITQCGLDQACTQQKRIDVSTAFFVENEFQLTGGYIYRIYKAAFGTLPNAPNRANLTYTQFISDRGRVVGGSQLDQSKSQFADTFVQRSVFTSRYPAAMTAEQYVDALNANTRNSLTQAERNALVNGLIGGSETRGSVLRKIADDQAFIDREYNASFVSTEYFDYLRRDADQAGYDFWLGQLNSFPVRDIGIEHAMVCSFITSAEYQQRFSSVITQSNGECPQ
jgi:glucose/arabinose dehydrogenase